MNTAQLIINLFELVAFIFSINFYKNQPTKPLKFLMIFLGLTFFVDIFGFYPQLIGRLSFLDFIKGTIYENNYWLYNFYLIISFLFYTLFFKWNIKNKKTSRYIAISAVIYLIASIFIIIKYGFLYTSFSPFSSIAGTILVLISVFSYYLEILKTEEIFQLKKSLTFYISIGTILFHLCLTPVIIYSAYFLEDKNPKFVSMYTYLVHIGNYILYSSFILGFVFCKKKILK